MELNLLQRAEQAERATAADEFNIIGEAALAVFGWQDERYQRVLRMLEAGASIDAALTLVPEGWVFLVGNRDLDFGRAGKSTALVGRDYDQEVEPVEAATPALALSSAALRARAAAEPQEGE